MGAREGNDTGDSPSPYVEYRFGGWTPSEDVSCVGGGPDHEGLDSAENEITIRSDVYTSVENFLARHGITNPAMVGGRLYWKEVRPVEAYHFDRFMEPEETEIPLSSIDWRRVAAISRELDRASSSVSRSAEHRCGVIPKGPLGLPRRMAGAVGRGIRAMLHM